MSELERTTGGRVVQALGRIAGGVTRRQAWLVARPLLVGIVSLGAGLLCLWGFAWRSARLASEVETPDALTWYSATELREFFAGIGESGRELYAATELSLDVVFPLAYVGLLTVLLYKAWRGRAPGLVLAAPLVAGVFDLLENATLAVMAWTFDGSVSPLAANVAAVFTLTKHLALGTSLLLIGAVFRIGKPPWVRFLGLVWVVVIALWISLFPIVLVPALLLALVIHLKWVHLLQYLFFERFVLLGALGLVLLPALADSLGEGLLLHNLLVLTGWWQVALASFLAGMLAMTLMWAARLVFLTAPTRFRLPLSREDYRRLWDQGLIGPPDERQPRPEDAAGVQRAADRHRTLLRANADFVRTELPGVVGLLPVLFALTALPLLLAVTSASDGPSWNLVPAAGALVFWVALAYFLRRKVPVWRERLSRWLSNQRWASSRFGRRVVRPLQLFLDPATTPLRGFGGQGHLRALLFVSIVAVVYAQGWLLDPASPAFPDWLPAVGFALLIAVVAVWVLSLLALLLDRTRVPVIATVLVVLFFANRASDSDHYFNVVPRPSTLDRLPTATEVFDGWHCRKERPDYITVVAASGGGIKASLWTARVLQALLTSPSPPELGRSIVLLSTTSGGSVGGMFFTEAFLDEPPDAEALERVVASAGMSSLAAVAWAMAYPDLWHFLSGGLLPVGSRTHDRGWALERRWEVRRARLERPPEDREAGLGKRLGDWALDVRRGRRPAHVFNATVVESGAAFRLGSVDLGTSSARTAPGSSPQEFWDFFSAASADIEVSTAARLSATFPWVSPMARAWPDPSLPLTGDSFVSSPEALRFADGGYFDNFGIFSALEFLEDIGPGHLQESGIRRVLLVQIRAAREGTTEMTEGGLHYSLAGPVMAMSSVRSSSQIARNDREVELLRELWAREGVRLETVVFEHLGPGPLSWHLSPDEESALLKGWSTYHQAGLAHGLRALRDDPEPTDSPATAAAPSDDTGA